MPSGGLRLRIPQSGVPGSVLRGQRARRPTAVYRVYNAKSELLVSAAQSAIYTIGEHKLCDQAGWSPKPSPEGLCAASRPWQGCTSCWRGRLTSSFASGPVCSGPGLGESRLSFPGPASFAIYTRVGAPQPCAVRSVRPGHLGRLGGGNSCWSRGPDSAAATGSGRGSSSVSPLTFGWDAVDRLRQSSFPCREDVSCRSRRCRRWCSAPMSVSG